MTAIARYKHPQGSVIDVHDNGAIVKTNPKGKTVPTSATADKLRAGHGGWTPIEVGESLTPTAPIPAQKAAPTRTLLPMKFREASVDKLPTFVTDEGWVLQQKLDGIRAQLVFEPGKRPWFRNGTGGQLASAAATAYTDPILKLLPEVPADSQGYTVDGEVLGGAFWVFDFILDGSEREPLYVRLASLEAWHDVIVHALDPVERPRHPLRAEGDVIRLLPTGRTIDEKAALAEAVYNQGGEGWIAKRLSGNYDWGQRVEHSLKLKITHTVDVVVLDRNRNREQNMVLGLHRDGVLEEVGCASAIGKPDTKPGDVVEVKYLYAGANGRLVQPTVLRLRTDKEASACTADQLRFADKSVVIPTERISS